MTDARPGRPAPRLSLSGLEWKLALTAVVSATYAFVLLAVGRPPAAPVAEQPSNPTAVVATLGGPAAAVTTTAQAGPAPRTVVARAAQPRIRTRSS